MAFIEDHHAVEIAAKPFDDLFDARDLLAAIVGAQGGIGGEQDPFGNGDFLALREPRQRRDQQALHAERRPVALGVLDQFVGFADPQSLATTTQEIVEDDAGGLTALARAGAVAEHEAATEANGVLCIFGGCLDDIEGFIDRPRSREEFAMGLAGINDGFKLRVRQQAAAQDFARKPRAIVRRRRRDARHRRRLHQLGRMGQGAGNADRLQAIVFVNGVGEMAAFQGRPVHHLIGEIGDLPLGVLAAGQGGMSGPP